MARLPGIRITWGEKTLPHSFRIRDGLPSGLQGEGCAKASPAEFTRKRQKQEVEVEEEEEAKGKSAHCLQASLVFLSVSSSAMTFFSQIGVKDQGSSDQGAYYQADQDLFRSR